ncbi:hypothetical protein [Blastococcus mobilis]|uniref:Uncharacterized protein n=1 Tax=Blastococcus mobilis TaxID=1938746 RepID=A0A238VN92_9ACTN|nr:hypothetical protein [Blastococcus mobilis]SNR35688.1 hypothetical protein SAMN06272737_1043 [Blastococcus mobilis]
MQAVLAALGILGTLGGVVLGGRLEHRRWLRDKRLQAYSAMNTAIGVWLKAYTHLERHDGGLAELTDAIGDLADKQQAVRLLGSATTRKRAHDTLAVAVAGYIQATAAAREERELTDEETDAVIEELGNEGQRLFEAQMADLHRRPDRP